MPPSIDGCSFPEPTYMYETPREAELRALSEKKDKQDSPAVLAVRKNTEDRRLQMEVARVEVEAITSPSKALYAKSWGSRRSPQKNVGFEPHYNSDPVIPGPKERGVLSARASPVKAKDLFGADLVRYDWLMDLFRRFDSNNSASLEIGQCALTPCCLYSICCHLLTVTVAAELCDLLTFVLNHGNKLFSNDWVVMIANEAFTDHFKYDKNRDGQMVQPEYLRLLVTSFTQPRMTHTTLALSLCL